jgi:hypothetical protein
VHLMNASFSQKERGMMRNVIKDATKCRDTIHLTRFAMYQAVASTRGQIRRSHCEMARSCWELRRYGTLLTYREAGASDAIRDCQRHT